MDALYKFLRGSGLQKDFTIEEWDVSKSQKKYVIVCSKMLGNSNNNQLKIIAPNDKSREAKLGALINVMNYLAINYVKVDNVIMNCVWDGILDLANTGMDGDKIKTLEYTINFKYKEEKIHD